MPGGRNAGGCWGRKNFLFFSSCAPTLLTPRPASLHRGILYSPQFPSHKQTKMATSRTQRSNKTTSKCELIVTPDSIHTSRYKQYSVVCSCVSILKIKRIIYKFGLENNVTQIHQRTSIILYSYTSHAKIYRQLFVLKVRLFLWPIRLATNYFVLITCTINIAKLISSPQCGRQNFWAIGSRRFRTQPSSHPPSLHPTSEYTYRVHFQVRLLSRIFLRSLSVRKTM